MYLLLLGVLFEHEGQEPLEQVNRHLPEGIIEREEQEVPLWMTTEQLAVVEGERSEQKAAWSAGNRGGGVELGGGGAVELGGGGVVTVGEGGGCVFGGGGGCLRLGSEANRCRGERRTRERK